MHILTYTHPGFYTVRAVISRTFTVRLIASVPFSAPGAMPVVQEFASSLCFPCWRTEPGATPMLCPGTCREVWIVKTAFCFHSSLQSIRSHCDSSAIRPGKVSWAFCCSHGNRNYLLYAMHRSSLCNVCLKNICKINREN